MVLLLVACLDHASMNHMPFFILFFFAFMSIHPKDTYGSVLLALVIWCAFTLNWNTCLKDYLHVPTNLHRFTETKASKLMKLLVTQLSGYYN